MQGEGIARAQRYQDLLVGVPAGLALRLPVVELPVDRLGQRLMDVDAARAHRRPLGARQHPRPAPRCRVRDAIGLDFLHCAHCCQWLCVSRFAVVVGYVFLRFLLAFLGGSSRLLFVTAMDGNELDYGLYSQNFKLGPKPGDRIGI